MKRLVRLGLMGVVAMGVTATTFAADTTVGRFYMRLAQHKQIGAVDAATSEASLRGMGYQLPAIALDKKLTEGDIAAISSSLGVSVTTKSPLSVVSESQVDAFITSFGSRLGSPNVPANEPGIYGQGTGGIDPGNSGNGKGKKKGHNKSTSEPF